VFRVVVVLFGIIYPLSRNILILESELIGMLTKQLHSAESQMRKMQSVLTKAEESLRTKDQEIGRLKRKVLCTLF